MLHEMIFAGFGGQGVLAIGQLLAYAGMLEDKKVAWMPAYGPEMRGGTANCTVIVSNENVGSPVVTEPSVILAMNEPSLDKFEAALKKDGILVYNSSLISRKPKRKDIKAFGINANEIATELGNTKAANMVTLGTLIKATQAVDINTVVNSINKIFPNFSNKQLDLNVSALYKGMELAKEA
jgi:2-oxoglutarate ferredoxin oxidoreductase subunit gamma